VKAHPYYCPLCKRKNEYYGRLVFPGPTADQIEAVAAHGGSLTLPEKPTCPNHGDFHPPLVPVDTTKLGRYPLATVNG
jgi:hypothetical protein